MASPTHTQIDQNINLGQKAATLSASQNDYDPGGDVMSFGLLGIVTISGSLHITGLRSNSVNGRIFGIITRSGAGDPFTLDNESASSSAANRFMLPGAGNLAIQQLGRSGILLIWNAVLGAWVSL